MSALERFTWPMERLGEALAALADAGGLPRSSRESPAPPAGLSSEEPGVLNRWLEAAGSWLGVEVEHLNVPYPEVDRFLRVSGPVLLCLPWEGGPRLLLIPSRGGLRSVPVLGPDRVLSHVPREEVRAALCRTLEEAAAGTVDRLLAMARLTPRRRERARRLLLREQIGGRWVERCWVLRPPPDAPLGTVRRQARLGRRTLQLLLAHAGVHALSLLAWWVIGRGALRGHLDLGILAAWALLLLTALPLRLLATWWSGMLALDAGTLIKQRLLVGALRLEPEEIRHQGVGQHLGRVLESEAVEGLVISGGLMGLTAVVELVMAAAVLWLGAGGGHHVLALAAVLVLAAALGWRYFHHRRRWTDVRLTLTHDLVERMVGHPTRLVQESRERWHQEEDQLLHRYVSSSQRMDRLAVWMQLVPPAWMLLGLVGMAPAFISGGASPASLAASLGGVLMAHLSLRKLLASATSLADAGIAWRQIAEVFLAASRPRREGHPDFVVTRPGESTRTGLLTAQGLSFRHPGRGTPVLDGCGVRIAPGQRLLLEGPSGGGKSTLASVLTGLRRADSGLLLLDGLDPQTLGEAGWRHRVIAVPQFHENHVLTSTFAFNLLMGRQWPPTPRDHARAQAICQELGLGPLLERMPGGYQQMLGEVGWQLSHGERSRLYIARALLQEAPLLILDESFGALDPENLERAMRCVLSRASSVLVIAHP